jgi:hypothetical protein
MAQSFIINPDLTTRDAIEQIEYRLYHIQHMCGFAISGKGVRDHGRQTDSRRTGATAAR